MRHRPELRAPAAARREPRLADRSAENAAGVEAFCRGAGIDLKQLPADGAARMLQLAGVLLREALLGLKGLALAQREIRDQVHIEVGKEDPQHIGLTGLPVDDLLLRLMIGHDRRDLDAVQWVRDMLASTRRHDLATMRALHSALGEFLGASRPRALAQIDGRPSGAATGNSDSSAWRRAFAVSPKCRQADFRTCSPKPSRALSSPLQAQQRRAFQVGAALWVVGAHLTSSPASMESGGLSTIRSCASTPLRISTTWP